MHIFVPRPGHPPRPRRFFSSRSISGLAVGAGLLLSIASQTSLHAQNLFLDVELSSSQGTVLLDRDALRSAAGSSASPTSPIYILTDPSFGELVGTSEGFEYRPTAAFWTVGHDSVTYALFKNQSDETLVARVFLSAALHGTSRTQEDFEDDVYPTLVPNPELTSGRQASAAITGSYGLPLDTVGVTGPVSLFSSNENRHFGTPSPGNGGDCLRILMPPDDDGTPFNGRQPVSLFSIGGGTFEVELTHHDPPTFNLRADTADGHETISGTAVTSQADAYLVHLDWWLSSGSDDGGAKLLVNGSVVAELSGLDNGTVWTEGQTWLTFQDTQGWDGLAVDDVDLRTSDQESQQTLGGYAGYPIRSRVFSDDFEAGNLDGWTNAFNRPYTLAADTQQPGNERLALTLDGLQSLVLHDPSPKAVKSVSASFSIDLKDASFTESTDMVLWSGHSENSPDAANQHLLLHLRYYNGNFQVGLSQRSTLSSPWEYNGWFNLPNSKTKHRLAVQWEAATHQSRQNGKMRLWVDGAPVIEKTGLQNAGQVVEAFRLGTRYYTSHASGLVYIDDYETWTQAPMP